MKFTIIPDDKTIIVDGFGYSELEFTIDNNIHAVQWYGDIGEIEYKSQLTNGGLIKPHNLIIDTYSQFRDTLAVWQEAKDSVSLQETTTN